MKAKFDSLQKYFRQKGLQKKSGKDRSDLK